MEYVYELVGIVVTPRDSSGGHGYSLVKDRTTPRFKMLLMAFFLNEKFSQFKAILYLYVGRVWFKFDDDLADKLNVDLVNFKSIKRCIDFDQV